MEANLMAAIPPHPNVLPLASFTQNDCASLLAMPFADGGDTLGLMESRGYTALPEVRQIWPNYSS